MINRKHINHAELLQLGKLLLLLTKRQQIELDLSSERNKRMTEVEKLARATVSALVREHPDSIFTSRGLRSPFVPRSTFCCIWVTH